MNKISNIYGLTESKIDKMLESHLKKIKASIHKLEKKISKSAFLLRSGDFGDIQAQRTLKKALEYHKSLIVEFELEYGKMARGVTNDFLYVQKIVETEFKSLGIPISFTTADRDMFRMLQVSTMTDFTKLSERVVTKLTQETYNAVIVGQSFGTFVNILKDGTKFLETNAKRLAHDSLMRYYTGVNVKKALDADIKTFLYYGDIIRSSRAFCIARVGKLFTVKEIKKWDDDKLTWKGKKPGSTIINRGGYNCRHSWHPCEEEWLEDGGIKVQNWHDEQGGMSSSLIKEVKTEENKLK